MNSEKKTRLEIKLKDIGPYESTSFECELDKTKIAIYADNGSGKTFLSRAFGYYQESVYEVDNGGEPLINDLLSLISFEKDRGQYSLKYIDKNDNVFETKATITYDSVSFENAEKPQLIYHVFNSDYIKNNFKVATHNPDSIVDKYIVGKSDIDVDEEKKNVDDKEKERNKVKEEIINKISDTKSMIKKQNIPSNINEYKLFEFDNLMSGVRQDEERTSLEIMKLLDKLASIPDGIMIEKITDNRYITNDEIDEISEIVCPKYEIKSKLEKFKRDKFNKKNKLISEGMNESDGETCPFCGQKYSDEALKLLEEYTIFIKDEDAQIKQEIDRNIVRLKETNRSMERLLKEYIAKKDEFNKLKDYVPSFKEKEFDSIDFESIECLTEKICKQIDEKKNALEMELDKSDFLLFKDKLNTLYSKINSINAMIVELSKIQENSVKERLALRKSLCKALFNELLDNTKNEVEELNKCETELNSAKEVLESKLAKAKIDRRKLLTEDFKTYLDLFFDGKYVYDDETGYLKFKNNKVSDAEHVLSDGEKGIVAFCHYMASAAKYVKDIKDYKRILFIIDDPVSSMDFNYVYAVAQMIKNIGEHSFMKGLPIRFIILTHNMDFMGILLQNRVATNGFILSNGVFGEIKDKDMIIPYTSHLLSVYKASNGDVCCEHTIPNSIRNILETIMRFENATDNLLEFVNNDRILSSNGDIYSMINDLSHGHLRNRTIYPREKLENACKTTVEFVNFRYPGQIREMNKFL